jgi:hypothetical protein
VSPTKEQVLREVREARKYRHVPYVIRLGWKQYGEILQEFGPTEPDPTKIATICGVRVEMVGQPDYLEVVSFRA